MVVQARRRCAPGASGLDLMITPGAFRKRDLTASTPAAEALSRLLDGQVKRRRRRLPLDGLLHGRIDRPTPDPIFQLEMETLAREHRLCVLLAHTGENRPTLQ